MKVGYDGRFLRAQPSGNGVFTQHMLDGMARLAPEIDYSVYLVDERPAIHRPNVTFRRMGRLHASAQLRFLATFPLELRRRPVDVFQAFYTVPVRTWAPVLLYLVEFGWMTNPGEFPASRLWLAQVSATTRFSIRRADHIAIPTHYWRERLLDAFGVPEERVSVVPIGLNELFLRRCPGPEIASVKRAHGVDGDYVLAVGDLQPRKNLARLVQAFHRLHETGRITHRLIVVGKDLIEADAVRREAAAGAARDAIVFTGYVPTAHLPALYQGATLFAFPSLDEGFGLPAHEAMASRTPVLASTAGSLPEVCGDAAVLVEPRRVEAIADGIARVLDSDSLREELVKRGLEQIRRFTWERSCRTMVSLHKQLALGGA